MRAMLEGMLAGKVAWITGGGSGIGAAAARALAVAGATVVISGRNASVLRREAEEISARGGTVGYEAVDVRDGIAVERVVRAIGERYGDISVLVHSAGTNTTVRRWSEQTVDGWEAVVRTNLDGVFLCTRAVLPQMRSSGDGLIVTVSSWAGKTLSKTVGGAYTASKYAAAGLTETINAEEGRNGIRATTIYPAEVSTALLERRPIKPTVAERQRMLRPGDLGEVIRWLAEQPRHVCINELVVSPTWNRHYISGID